MRWDSVFDTFRILMSFNMDFLKEEWSNHITVLMSISMLYTCAICVCVYIYIYIYVIDQSV